MEKKHIHEIIKTIDGEEWKKIVEKTFNKIAPKIKVEGFRAGKAPREKIIAKYGEYNLYLDAVDSVSNDTFLSVIKDSKLIPVVMPKMELIKVDGNGAEIKFTITTRPEVKLGEYKNLDIKKEKVKISKKDVDHKIEHLKKDFAEIVIKEDGKLVNGETAVIDYLGTKDGVAFDGGKSENYPLEIGSNTFIPGFEEQLIGMSVGEEKDINLTFPSEYHSEELKGKDVVFHVKLNEIRTKMLPELNEEFFKDLGYEEVKTIEEFESKIKEELELAKQGEIDNKYVDDALELIIKNSEMEVVSEEVDEEIKRMLGQFEQQVNMQGVTLEQYCEFAKTTKEDLEKNLLEPATTRVKSRMVLEAIAKEEKFDITDEEVEEEIKKLSIMYQMTEEELIESFQGKDTIKYDMKMQRAINLIKG